MAQRPPGFTTTRDIRMEIAGYRISDILGDGATGVVYAATSPQGRPVALKVLKPELVSPRERQRFLEEAERLRRVRHPSLVELVDSGPTPDGGAYIAMARLEGQNLFDRLQRGPMRFDRALALFEQIAGALGAMHQAGLVHRDVKPENIFVEEGDARALLLDLGIARDVSADPSTTTRAGMIRGTPAYMAPERFFGKPATAQTDLYELAVVLYVTLVGALPWSSVDDPTERLRPAAPSARGVVLPPRLQTTLMRALSSQADQRPRSADEFAAAVIDALSPESMQLIVGQRTGRSALPPAYGTGPEAYSPTSQAPRLPQPAHFAPAPTGQVGPHAWNAGPFPPNPGSFNVPPSAQTPFAAPAATTTKPAASTAGALWAIAALLAIVVFGTGGLLAFTYWRVATATASSASSPAKAAETVAGTLSVPSAPPPISPISTGQPSKLRERGDGVSSPFTPRPPRPRAGEPRCQCLPFAATSTHGSNMGLAASATTLPLCECPQMCLVRLSACKDVGPTGVCRDSRSDRCPERFREGQQVGTPCSGFNGNNEPGTGKWTCDFAGGRFFDGASGGSCEGFTVDGLKVKGRLNCD